MSDGDKAMAAGEEKKPVILVIDDVADNRIVVCRRLGKMGYTPLAADSARSGLSSIYASKPDLVLLDYMMPDMDGLAVLRELRANALYATMPVIMLTARTDPETVVSVLDAGASDYVSKPIDFTILQARIEAQLQRAAQFQERDRTIENMDRQHLSTALKTHALMKQLDSEIARRSRLEQELATVRTAPEPAASPTGRTGVAERLQRAEMLNRRLIEQGSGLNLAVLMEIGSHLKAALAALEAESND